MAKKIGHRFLVFLSSPFSWGEADPWANVENTACQMPNGTLHLQGQRSVVSRTLSCRLPLIEGRSTSEVVTRGHQGWTALCGAGHHWNCCPGGRSPSFKSASPTHPPSRCNVFSPPPQNMLSTRPGGCLLLHMARGMHGNRDSVKTCEWVKQMHCFLPCLLSSPCAMDHYLYSLLLFFLNIYLLGCVRS